MRMAMTNAPAHPLATGDRVRSVTRALSILDALAADPSGQTAKGLAAAVGLAVPTTYHLLNTLVASGYAARDPETRLFTLGPRIPQLHQAFLERARPSPYALPFLQALHQTTGEAVYLQQLVGEDTVTTELIAGRERLPVGVGYIGFSLPAHVTAAGRVLLAWSPPDRLRTYLSGRYGHSAGPFPPAEAVQLHGDVARIRVQGYETDRGSGDPDVWCVAAPILTAAGEAKEALSIVTNRARFAQNEKALIAAMRAIAQAASAVAAARGDLALPAVPLVRRDAAEVAERAIKLPA
jgi:IclR family acetate operon transcriptional repressor